MSQRQYANGISIDEILTGISNTWSGEIDPGDVPAEIESIARGLASEQPPMSPLVVLKAIRWWYIHGKGGSDPVFRWVIRWARHLATDTLNDVEMLDECLKYLVAVGFTNEPHEPR